MPQAAAQRLRAGLVRTGPKEPRWPILGLSLSTKAQVWTKLPHGLSHNPQFSTSALQNLFSGIPAEQGLRLPSGRDAISVHSRLSPRAALTGSTGPSAAEPLRQTHRPAPPAGGREGRRGREADAPRAGATLNPFPGPPRELPRPGPARRPAAPAASPGPGSRPGAAPRSRSCRTRRPPPAGT